MADTHDPDGRRFAEIFKHGSLSVELYAPREHDSRLPHTRDEAYTVVKDQGTFVNGEQQLSFAPEGEGASSTAGSPRG